MKISSKLDDDLLLDKKFSVSDIIIVAAFVYEINGKYYPQFF